MQDPDSTELVEVSGHQPGRSGEGKHEPGRKTLQKYLKPVNRLLIAPQNLSMHVSRITFAETLFNNIKFQKMKKLIIASLLLFGLTGMVMAQTTPAKKTTTKPKTETVSKDKKTATTATTTSVAKQAEKTSATTKVKSTESARATTAPKQSTAATAPVKKDGTPDKRYNANKKLKKDGTPDKRFKENKKSN